jgi:hypothetical protein
VIGEYVPTKSQFDPIIPEEAWNLLEEEEEDV